MMSAMPDLASIELVWPQELHAHGQMRQFIDELSVCASVNEAFVTGLEDDPDNEGVRRPDLVEIAQARLRAWGADDDAVVRAFDIFMWLVREVVRPGFPSVPVDVPDDFTGCSVIARGLKPHVESARGIWHQKYQLDEAKADREWAQMEVVEQVAQGAEYLGFLPRRINIKKYKAKLQWNSRPLSVCDAVASAAGRAFINAVELRPELAAALTRLGHTDFLDVGVSRRAREALHAAGITEFGAGLEQLVIGLLRRYDSASSSRSITPSQALLVAEQDSPRAHEAVVLLVESPQLSGRPIPPTAATFAAAAEEVLGRAMAEVVAHLHSQSAGLAQTRR
jgi:hypothetical protein